MEIATSPTIFHYISATDLQVWVAYLAESAIPCLQHAVKLNLKRSGISQTTGGVSGTMLDIQAFTSARLVIISPVDDTTWLFPEERGGNFWGACCHGSGS